ncbi:MAG: hypothetical protein V7K77_04620 [Nostoc sp.]|uniref:hypothetical protein n=1 Tax=Nostoc sp. TaxID=1180 RepID=UPI002FF7F24C
MTEKQLKKQGNFGRCFDVFKLVRLLKVIYKNKYTDAVGFDYFDFAQYKFAQPTYRSRVERTPTGKQATRSVSKSCRNSTTEVFSLSEIT